MPTKRPNCLSLFTTLGFGTTTLLLGFLGGAVAQGQTRLTILQNSLLTDARKINGRVYVPIADVARTMGWKLSVTKNTISLQPPMTPVPNGGNTSLPTNPIAGGIGDIIPAPNATFQVSRVSETFSYERRYTNGIAMGGTVATMTPNEKLVVIDCVLTNASKEREEFCFSRDRYAENTTLLDQSGESLPPTAIDVAADELNPPGAYALAGANIRFALVFKVPKSWQPKALVYTIVRYRARGMKKGTDVRVNL